MRLLARYAARSAADGPAVNRKTHPDAEIPAMSAGYRLHLWTERRFRHDLSQSPATMLLEPSTFMESWSGSTLLLACF